MGRRDGAQSSAARGTGRAVGRGLGRRAESRARKSACRWRWVSASIRRDRWPAAKIAHARAAAQRVLNELADGDLVSLHTFSDDAVQRVPQSPLTAQGRRWMSAVIEELGADGGTNLFEGVRFAEAVSAAAPETHPVRRVVLISDGRATAGNTSTHALAQLAEAGLPRGVQVTAVGIGMDYDEATLNALALRSSGRLYHVADSTELTGDRRTRDRSAREHGCERRPARDRRCAGRDVARRGGCPRDFGRLDAARAARELARRPIARARGARPHERREAVARAAAAERAFALPGSRRQRIGRVQEVVARAAFTEPEREGVEPANPRAQAIIAMQQAAVLANDASAQANAGNLAIAEQRLAQAETELRRGAAQASDKRETRPHAGKRPAHVRRTDKR